jgi:hypothetical protein
MPRRLEKAKSDHRRRDRAINVHLGPDIKAQWAAYCEQLGKTPGAALKEAIEHKRMHPTAIAMRCWPRSMPRRRKRNTGHLRAA